MSAPTPLYACVWAREFPAQALLRLRPELRNRPCVVLEGEPPQQTVCAMNVKANVLGVTHGMTKLELETFSNVAVLKRSRTEEAAAKTVLLECASAFSPRVEDRTQSTSFCCVLDIRGTEKLLGPPMVLTRSLQAKMRALGIYGSIAISNNFYTSVCLARGFAAQYGIRVVLSGQEAISLAELPLSVLDLSENHANTFSLWGIRTLGMLAALPEKDLIARIGQQGKRHRELARGEYPHLFLPVEAGLLFEEAREMDSPVETLDSLLFVIAVLLEQLVLRATAHALALAAVTITLTLEGRNPLTRTVRPALPTNDRQLWIKLLHLDLEAHPPQAAILALTLHADPGNTSKLQLGLFSPQMPEPVRLEVTLARIRAIVGEKNVGFPELRDTHHPDQHTMKPFAITASTAVRAGSVASRSAVRQLRPAGISSVTLKHARPQIFTFRNQRYTVQHAYGPWRSSGNWWNGMQDSANAWDTEQWDLIARAEDASLLSCCILHVPGLNRWQVAALYD